MQWRHNRRGLGCTPCYKWTSVVARPILVVGSKPNLVHKGRAVEQNYSCLDIRPSLMKCNLGEICAGQRSVFCSECWVEFVGSGQACQAPPTAHHSYNTDMENQLPFEYQQIDDCFYRHCFWLVVCFLDMNFKDFKPIQIPFSVSNILFPHLKLPKNSL